MTQAESEFKSALRKKLVATECNALIYASVGSVFSIRGIPDWYLSHRIWRGWLELKVNDNPYSPHQKTELRRLASRGDQAFGLRRIQNDLILETVGSEDKVFKVSVCNYYNKLSGIELLSWLRSV